MISARFHKNKQIIVFYGIDGSGKSTLIRYLSKKLRKCSYNIKVVSLRGHHTIMYVLIRILFRIKGIDYKFARGKPLYLNYMVLKYFKSKKLYILLEIAGVLVWFIVKIFPLVVLATLYKDYELLIMADRYTPDFAVLLSLTSKISNDDMVRIARFLERIQPLRPLYFYVYTDPAIALKRKSEERLTMSFCNLMDTKYRALNKYIHPVLLIDTTNKRPEEILPIIIRELNKHGIISRCPES